MSWEKKRLKPGKSERKIPSYTGEQPSWNINAKTNEEFAQRLDEKLNQRLLEYDNSERKSRKDRYAIFSQCFEEIILHHGSYATLLSDIKHEYENCIATVFRGEKEAAYLYRNLSSRVSGLGTLENYKQQIGDLKKKIKIIRENNKYFKENNKEKSTKQEKETDISTKGVDFARQELEHQIFPLRGQVSQRKPSRVKNCEFGKFRVKVLDRYSPNEQTNIEFLSTELRRLRNEIKELVRFFDKRFKLRKTKERLIEKLMEKERLKNELEESRQDLKVKLLKLEEMIKEERRQRDLVMAKPTNILQLLLMAIKQSGNDDDFVIDETIEDELTVDDQSEASEEDDPFMDQEQEEMVEYMEKFEQLFNQGNYEEAATVATTSPQDILKTATTFQRFKEQQPSPGEKSPLLFYCEAVIVNCACPGQKGLSASESSAAVERALKEGRRDLVLQWVSQNKLKYSDILGDTIIGFCSCGVVCACGCYTLAELVYRKTKTHGKVVSCLCRQGRLHMAANHARNVGKFRKFEFMEILREYPTFEHAMVLLQVGDGYLSSPLCREECITSLVKANRPRDAARLLRSSRDRIQCAKMIGYVEQEDKQLWNEFKTVLEEQEFVNAACDVSCALILADVFYVANVKLSL